MKKLCDLLDIVVNNEFCVLYKVRDNARMDLISLGCFNGNEDMIRITKGRTPEITIFKNNDSLYKKAPSDYLGYVQNVQCQGGATKYGGIININELHANLCNDCCLPEDLATMDVSRYQEFLAKRRVLIAQRLKEYYFSL